MLRLNFLNSSRDAADGLVKLFSQTKTMDALEGHGVYIESGFFTNGIRDGKTVIS